MLNKNVCLSVRHGTLYPLTQICASLNHCKKKEEPSQLIPQKLAANLQLSIAGLTFHQNFSHQRSGFKVFNTNIFSRIHKAIAFQTKPKRNEKAAAFQCFS